MFFSTRLGTAFAIAIVAALLADWTKPYPMKLGGPAAALIAAVLIVILWLTRTRPAKLTRGRESLLREVFLGAVAAVVWFGAMHLYFQVAQRTDGFAAMMLDRGRETIERDAALLESVGNSKEAAEVILTFLETPHSPECEKRLAERAILDLTKASKTGGHESATSFLNQAIEVAARFEVPDDHPRAALERLTDREKLDGLNGRVGNAEERALKAEQERSRLEGDLKSLQSSKAQSEHGLRVGFRQLVERMISHSVELSDDVIRGDLQSTRQELLQVIQETKPQGGSEAALKGALKKIEAEISALQPINLPPGATARVRKVDSNVMPGMIVVDIEVVDATGKPFAGLLTKDFTAVQSGRKLKGLASPFSRTGVLTVSIVLDISSSTEGPAIAATRAAAPEFIARLAPEAFVRVATFSDRLNVLADFTRDKRGAITAIQGIRAGGGTALNQSSYVEIRVLSARPGIRVLVVFTDGANSLPGPRVEELIAAARNAKVAVHFVALQGAGFLDTSAIQKIARETGGRTFLVQDAARLSGAFRSLADSLQETGYRLALLDHDPKSPLQLTIGGKGAVQLAVESGQTPNSLAQRQVQ